MKPWHWAVLAVAALVVLYLVTRPTLSRPPSTNLTSSRGTAGSVLDSLNSGATKLKTLFGTLFGSTSTPETVESSL